jgi:hypothetical protein
MGIGNSAEIGIGNEVVGPKLIAEAYSRLDLASKIGCQDNLLSRG